MIKVVSEVTSDIAISVRHILSGIFLVAGFNVCVATAAFLSALLLGEPGKGVTWFTNVMGYRGSGLNETFREILQIFNWTALGAVLIFAGYSFSEYCAAASRRPASKVVDLPVRRVFKNDAAENNDTPQVANL